MANINIILEAGLTNDYGVFNLDLGMIKDKEKNCLSVDIISDGDQFVESENSEFQHGGNTNYKDHEGIKPIDSNIPKWKNYGSRLVEKLRKYLINFSFHLRKSHIIRFINIKSIFQISSLYKIRKFFL